MRYMLDTNMVSHLLREHPAVVLRVMSVPMSSLCISAITEGELSFGLQKRPEATRLRRAVAEFLARVDSKPWDSTVAQRYGTLRAELESSGKSLSPLDLQIAAHAQALNAILVTNDLAFNHVGNLQIENWTQ